MSAPVEPPVSPALDERFQAFRFVMLREMALLPDPPKPKELSHANGVWKRLRKEATTFATKLRPGEARAWFRQRIFSTPEFRRFSRLRDERRRADPRYQASRREVSKEWYETVGRERRSTPEMRAKLAEQARLRYAEKKRLRAILEQV